MRRQWCSSRPPQDSSIAVTALKAGAADYLVKDMLRRFHSALQVAVNGALRQAQNFEKPAMTPRPRSTLRADRYAALAAEREVLLREVKPPRRQ